MEAYLSKLTCMSEIILIIFKHLLKYSIPYTILWTNNWECNGKQLNVSLNASAWKIMNPVYKSER